MKNSNLAIGSLTVSLSLLNLLGCGHDTQTPSPSPVVGAWYVRVPGAPFEYQMYLFNADGTMQESNPDAGDARTSDSAGYGAWTSDGDTITAKFVEITADRRTHAFVTRGEVTFDLAVDHDHLTGSAVGRFYDARGKLVFGPVHAGMDGSRVKPR